jgi:hypothetical protein
MGNHIMFPRQDDSEKDAGDCWNKCDPDAGQRIRDDFFDVIGIRTGA